MSENIDVQTDIHKRVAGEVIRLIVTSPIEAGGNFTDVLAILESVIVGVIYAIARLGGDEIVLERVAERVKERLAELRLSDIEPGGSA